MNALIEKKVLYNSVKGLTDKRGGSVGFYKTKNKRYIEDKYVNLAKRLLDDNQ